MSQNKKILVLGGAYIELLVNVARMPERNETLTDDGGVAYIPGGIASTAARCMKGFNTDAFVLTKLGADLHGQKLFNLYKDAGIETSAIKVDHDYPTAFTVTVREGDDSERRVIYPGALAHLSTENVIDAFKTEPDALYISLDAPGNAILTAAKIASNKGVPIILDAYPLTSDVPFDAMPPVDLLILGRDEAKQLSGGIDPITQSDVLRCVLNITKKIKTKKVVIRQPQRGTYIYENKHINIVPINRGDKSGRDGKANEIFSSTLSAVYLNNGENLKDAAKYATAASAYSEPDEDGNSLIPTREDILHLL